MKTKIKHPASSSTYREMRRMVSCSEDLTPSLPLGGHWICSAERIPLACKLTVEFFWILYKLLIITQEIYPSSW